MSNKKLRIKEPDFVFKVWDGHKSLMVIAVNWLAAVDKYRWEFPDVEITRVYELRNAPKKELIWRYGTKLPDQTVGRFRGFKLA